MPGGIQNGKNAEITADKNCSASVEVQFLTNNVITCFKTLAGGNK